jgi:hypothetical protein
MCVVFRRVHSPERLADGLHDGFFRHLWPRRHLQNLQPPVADKDAIVERSSGVHGDAHKPPIVLELAVQAEVTGVAFTNKIPPFHKGRRDFLVKFCLF